MKTISALAVLALYSNLLFSQFNLELVSRLPYHQEIDDVWGYVSPAGEEYALVCTRTGTSIVQLSDLEQPVEIEFIPGDSSLNREAKTWGQYAYITAGNGDDGLLIIDLSGLPGDVTWQFFKPLFPGFTEKFKRAHTLWLDEFGYIYLNGSNIHSSGVVILDAFSNPGNVIYAGKTTSFYAHDCHVRNNLLFAAEPSPKQVSVFDVSDKSNPVLLSSVPVPGGYTHSLWLNEEGNILMVSDEVEDSYFISFDVSDLQNIRQLDQFRLAPNPCVTTIPHNIHVLDNFLVGAYYLRGCILLDIARPDNLIEVGRFDTDFTDLYDYFGNFGVYPYLPSGVILAADLKNGLFILRPKWQRACYFEGSVKDAKTGLALIGASVKIHSEENPETKTNLSGIFKTGQAKSGSFEAIIEADGYMDFVTTIQLENGELTLLEAVLEPLNFPSVVKVTDKASGKPISGAFVTLESQGIITTEMTGVEGVVFFENEIEGNYTIQVGKWGYRLGGIANPVLSLSESLVFALERGYEDNFSMDFGWTGTGEPKHGRWERGVPADTPVWTECHIGSPLKDHPEDLGAECFVTGLKPDSIWMNDDIFGMIWLRRANEVDSPGVMLTSPVMRIKSNFLKPALSYSTWFAKERGSIWNEEFPKDSLLVFLDNGKERILLDALTENHQWKQSPVFFLDEIIALTDSMRLIFETHELQPFTYLEAGVDNFKVVETFQSADFHIQEGVVKFRVFPNPFYSQFTIEYETAVKFLELKMLIFNALGQLVEEIALDNSKGRLDRKVDFPKGVYFIAFRLDGAISGVQRIIGGG